MTDKLSIPDQRRRRLGSVGADWGGTVLVVIKPEWELARPNPQ